MATEKSKRAELRRPVWPSPPSAASNREAGELHVSLLLLLEHKISLVLNSVQLKMTLNLILLPLPPACWDHSIAPSSLADLLWEWNPGLCPLGHSPSPRSNLLDIKGRCASVCTQVHECPWHPWLTGKRTDCMFRRHTH